MFEQSPIVGLVLAIFLVAIVIKQSINKRKFLKTRLLFIFLVIFIFVFELFFYNDIKEDDLFFQVVTYANIAIYVLIGIYYLLSVELSLSHDNFQKEVISSLDDTKIFVQLDKKERVKEISSLFAKELGYEKDDCINKKFFTLLDNSVKIYSFNNQEIDNAGLKDYYSKYKSTATLGSHTYLEVLCENRAGEDLGLYLMESPIFVMNKYAGRLLIGDKKSEESLVGMEHDLNKSNKELEAIRLRFVTLLENATDGIAFTDLNEDSVWLNDTLVKALNLTGNSVTIDDYRGMIHSDDKQLYLSKIASLSVNNPNFEMTYRYKTGANYVFVKEIGKRIFGGKGIDEIVSIINVIKNTHFERSAIAELDGIEYEPEMLARATMFQSKNKPYQFVYFKVDSIPEINEKYGRNVGNMALSGYVKLIHDNFVNDNQIYRVGGLEFVALVTDLRKMDVLKNNLENQERLLHIDSSYGSINIHLEIYMGISLSTDFATTTDGYKAARESFRFATKPQVQSNYAYYKDIR